MKKTIALLSTILLAGATSLGSIVNANALLTAPSVVFDIAYRNNGNFGSWYYYLGDGTTTASNWNWNNPGSSLPTFERSTDGAYYNYMNTTNFGGLEITQTYNRSNSGWNLYSGGPNYVPYFTNKIGSDNNVGTIDNKVYLKFDNNTFNDYRLWLDFSDSPSTSFAYVIDSNGYGNTELFIYNTDSTYTTLYLSSFTNQEIYFVATSSSRYLTAFYLEDLGQSSSYANGYDQGYIDGQNDQIFDAPGGIFGVIGNAFNAVANVMDIQILPGNITLGSVFGALLAIAVLFSFLNLLSANPRTGKK